MHIGEFDIDGSIGTVAAATTAATTAAAAVIAPITVGHMDAMISNVRDGHLVQVKVDRTGLVVTNIDEDAFAGRAGQVTTVVDIKAAETGEV